MRMDEERPLAGLKLKDSAPELLARQMQDWELCRLNYGNLGDAVHKPFTMNGIKLVAQWNPGRLSSTSAKTDPASIAARPCFLCDENRPPEQEAVISGDYKILVNPFPLFEQHYSIVHRRHRKQSIRESFKQLLDMSRSFGEDYFLLYNGPECGASAPDHLHFQAGLAASLPLASELATANSKSAASLHIDQNSWVYFPDDGLRRYILLEGTNVKTLKEIFLQIYAAYQTFSNATVEPLMNLLVFYHAALKKFTVLIFPRLKHRPAVYFKPDPEKFLFSPASSDIGGLCILPRREDFDRTTGLILKSCLTEVMLPEDMFLDLINAITTGI